MMRRSLLCAAGVSGMAVYAPPAKVCLKDWCDWSGNKWDKVSSVVGDSFRIPAANENAYTMAANAVMRLILNNKIDPRSVGFLGLGTESSTDNSAGAVIIRGMIDLALRDLGMPALSRQCEVPEHKHACLGGIYALKNAGRFVDTQPSDRVAIVVASDIAEYARGSTGEQTQGAGAVAMLVEKNPKLFELDLARTGSGSCYRGPDFRKPFKRHFMKEYVNEEEKTDKIPDFPVFSGPYSTVSYLEEVATAVEAMLDRLEVKPSRYYNDVQALFFHRPYNMMPIQAMSFLYARGLARATSDEHREHLTALCAKAKVTEDAIRAELTETRDLFTIIDSKGKTPADLFAATNAVAKVLRADPRFAKLLESKMSVGSKTMASFGNLYTAALPCWIAAGFEEAYEAKQDIAGRPMVIIGYGSGDAAEAIPIVPVKGWEEAASKLAVTKALENHVTLTHEQYGAMHSGKMTEDPAAAVRKGEFVIDRIGDKNEPAFQDIGIEYYRYIQ